MRCQAVLDNARCHARADTELTFGTVGLMKLCWDHADELMRNLRDAHAAAGRPDEAIDGYRRFVADMERQKQRQKAASN